MSVLGLVGCGLLGGSVALATKQNGCFDKVLGRDADPLRQQEAQDLGVTDGPFNDDSHVDAVCVAVPTQAIAKTIKSLLAEHDSSTPIFDVGSVKASVLTDMQSCPPNFIPCHPIAGSHKSGPGAATADLFRDRVCVLTPTPTTNDELCDKVAGWWRQIGANVLTVSATSHDEAVALTSHLPHLISFAAVSMLKAHDPSTTEMVGKGFIDFSRIAAGDATMWRSIFVDNLDKVRLSFRELVDRAEHMLALAESDPDALERELSEVAAFRDALNDE